MWISMPWTKQFHEETNVSEKEAFVVNSRQVRNFSDERENKKCMQLRIFDIVCLLILLFLLSFLSDAYRSSSLCPPIEPVIGPTPTPESFLEIMCPGNNAEDFCDCDSDCTDNPSFCACPEAQRCCGEDTDSNSDDHEKLQSKIKALTEANQLLLQSRTENELIIENLTVENRQLSQSIQNARSILPMNSPNEESKSMREVEPSASTEAERLRAEHPPSAPFEEAYDQYERMDPRKLNSSYEIFRNLIVFENACYWGRTVYMQGLADVQGVADFRRWSDNPPGALPYWLEVKPAMHRTSAVFVPGETLLGTGQLLNPNHALHDVLKKYATVLFHSQEFIHFPVKNVYWGGMFGTGGGRTFPAWYFEVQRLLGITDDRSQNLQASGKPVCFERLYHVVAFRPAFGMDRRPSPFAEGDIGLMGGRVADNVRLPPQTDQILVYDRNYVPHIGKRGLGHDKRWINSWEVVRTLREKGYNVNYIHEMPVDVWEQVALVSAARVILWPFGGQSANLMFAHPGTLVVSMSCHHRTATDWVLAADMDRQFNFTYVYLSRNMTCFDEFGPQKFHTDFYMQPKTILSLVDWYLKGQLSGRIVMLPEANDKPRR